MPKGPVLAQAPDLQGLAQLLPDPGTFDSVTDYLASLARATVSAADALPAPPPPPPPTLSAGALHACHIRHMTPWPILHHHVFHAPLHC